jgi:RNA polymerase sigma-70 factor (ECF subfamily)
VKQYKKEYKLIKKIVKGDTEKFMELIEPYKNKLYNFLVSRINNTDDSEDLLQEIFIKCYSKLNTFKFKSAFYTWLFSITLNELKNYYRKKQKNKKFSLDKENDNGTNFYDTLKDTGCSADYKLFDIQLNQHINDSLLELSDVYREVIILFYFDKLSYKKIADKLNIKLGTVKSRISEAREQLKNIIDKSYI